MAGSGMPLSFRDNYRWDILTAEADFHVGLSLLLSVLIQFPATTVRRI